MSALAHDDEVAWVEVGAEIVNELKRRDARLNALEAQQVRQEAAIAALKKELDAREYKGVWESDRGYLRHNQITYDGSGWIAVRDTRARPGTPNSGWKLHTKRGRDGKDAR